MIIIYRHQISLRILSAFNPLQPGVAFLYPLDVFRGDRKATLGCNGLSKLNEHLFHLEITRKPLMILEEIKLINSN